MRLELSKRRAKGLPGKSFMTSNSFGCRNNIKNTTQDVNSMNTIHFHQPRGYVEDFLDKFLLYRIASEVKIGLFSPIWQTVLILAKLFVPKHPISARNVFILHETVK